MSKLTIQAERVMGMADITVRVDGKPVIDGLHDLETVEMQISSLVHGIKRIAAATHNTALEGRMKQLINDAKKYGWDDVDNA